MIGCRFCSAAFKDKRAKDKHELSHQESRNIDLYYQKMRERWGIDATAKA